MYAEFKEPLYAPPPLLLRMVEAGLLGRKTGHGFFDYPPPQVAGAVTSTPYMGRPRCIRTGAVVVAVPAVPSRRRP